MPKGPSAKSLILDLLSTLRRGSMPVRALVEAGALFGLAENNVRVSLARLLAARLVARDERGRYRLGDAASAVDAHVSAWRRAAERMQAWAGDTWVAVHLPSPRPGSRRTRREDYALRLLGFQPLAPGLAIRPDNLSGGVAALRRELAGLGLRDSDAVMGLGELSEPRGERALSLWDAEVLQAERHAAHAAVRASQERLDALPVERAMAESFVVGGAAIRVIAHDPLLPDPIVPFEPLAELIALMREYDRAGRARWADFLASHGVVHHRADERAPADLRVADATAALPSLHLDAPREGAAP